ncbi:PucR family transcriptional regulator [Paenibacillus albicereus]|uniref:PucR family transcriptional regulator n=1 Tax=Paenibacillus albicereus TaxID=2726185 RepID=A0A6H2GV07_9BACL|nr:PucR family transcriptional regulator [Paenibacillus albicereus]QJC51237.1 PucR family transcriptional regulator [Paenibacillus albicereus]
MRIGDLIHAPMLGSSRLVAGKEGLDRLVSSVNMMDSPDIFDFLKPSELLLTTAYAVKDQPEVLVRLVEEMGRLGCAGLGIKTKRYFDRIPPELIEAADRHRLPLLELGLDCSLADAVQQLMARILQVRTEEMRYALLAHRQLTELVMEGRSLQDLIEAVGRLIGLPVLLLGAEGEPVASSGIVPEEAFSSRLASETDPPGIEHPLTGAIFRRLRESFGRSSLRPVYLPLDDVPSCRWSGVLAAPIHTTQLQGGLLAACESGAPDEMAYQTLEQAANVASFELLKTLAVRERSRRFKHDFLSDVVDGLIAQESEIARRGRRYGLEPDRPYVCAVIKKDPPAGQEAGGGSSPQRMDRRERDELYEAVKKAARSAGLGGLLFAKQDGLAMIEPCLQGGPSGLERLLGMPLQRVVLQAGEALGIGLSCGIGNPSDRLSSLSRSFQEAGNAWKSGLLVGKRRFLQFSHVQELPELLRMLPLPERRRFVAETFGALDTAEESEELRRTLRAYYEHQGRIADTAKALYVHRNTVLYRMAKIEQLCGRSLRAPADSLRFRTAFQLEELDGSD